MPGGDVDGAGDTVRAAQRLDPPLQPIVYRLSRGRSAGGFARSIIVSHVIQPSCAAVFDVKEAIHGQGDSLGIHLLGT
jgi:hypothetical protein